MLEGCRYRLYPDAAQAVALRVTVDSCRALYNAALEQRQRAWREHNTSIGLWVQCRELTEARAEVPWLRAGIARAQQQTLRDLDDAYRRFFAGQSQRPRFRSVRAPRQAFRIPQARSVPVRRVSSRWGQVRVPGLGWVRFRWSRPLRKELIRHATFTVTSDGRWHVSFCVDARREAAAYNRGPAVGIDRGVAAPVALSTGELTAPAGLPVGQQERLRRLRRKAGRQETARRRRPSGQRTTSGRQRSTQAAIANLLGRESRIRTDAIHKLSRRLAETHGLVVLEDLNTAAMTRSAKGTVEQPGRGVRQKAGLNRSILVSGWGELRRQLAYKTERYGSELRLVPATYTSQTCAQCAHVDRGSRKSQATFRCTACGHVAHADINAARVILQRGTTGAGWALAARGALQPQSGGATKREPPQGQTLAA